MKKPKRDRLLEPRHVTDADIQDEEFQIWRLEQDITMYTKKPPTQEFLCGVWKHEKILNGNPKNWDLRKNYAEWLSTRSELQAAAGQERQAEKKITPVQFLLAGNCDKKWVWYSEAWKEATPELLAKLGVPPDTSAELPQSVFADVPCSEPQVELYRSYLLTFKSRHEAEMCLAQAIHQHNLRQVGKTD